MAQVQLLWVSNSLTPLHARVKAHSHPYYHLFCVISGEMRFTADDKQYELLPGHCLLVPKNTEHAYLAAGSTPANYYEIKFSLPEGTLDAEFAHAGVLTSDSPLAAMLSNQIVSEYSQLGNLADDAATTYLLALLNALTQEQRCLRPRNFRFIDGSGYSALAQEIIHYLEDHYAENVTLDELASALGYNKSYLCSAFKKDTRITINDCLNLIRIRRAAELITYSDHALAQVSAQCGFSSTSHFNRVFLKYAGINPGQCRRAYPLEILTKPGSRPTKPPVPVNTFMYSVLAQKQITLEMIGLKTEDPVHSRPHHSDR